MDKQEIIDQARRIGTFETPSIPDQDCGQLIVPKHPATKARLADVDQAERGFDPGGLVRFGVENAAEEEIIFP